MYVPSHTLSIVENERRSSKFLAEDERKYKLIATNKRKNIKLASIEVRDGFKNYGIYNHWRTILKGCNLKANSGEIYAILGPHDSGKTTILHLLLGLTELNHGEVEVFGFNPRNPLSGIPGNRVGFTPQRQGLYLEFTIEEILRYYAGVLNLNSELVNRRILFLYDLLFLPRDKHVLKLQDDNIRRRVSFAIAMLHEPELIILDEPTKGINPAIRNSIWKHLLHLSNEENITIIVTTQNSIEAEYAHRVGILHEGRIVMEGSPKSLIDRCAENSLDSVYTKIYMSQRDSIDNLLENMPNTDFAFPESIMRRSSSEGFAVTTNSLGEVPKGFGISETSKKFPSVLRSCLTIQLKTFLPNINVIMLISWKNYLMIQRNVGWSVYFLLVSLSLLILFYYGMGHFSKHIPFGVYNGEVTNECYAKYYSCQILYRMNRQIAKFIFFRDLDALMKHAHNGLLSGYMIFPKDFTQTVRSELAAEIFGDDVKVLDDLTFITISLDRTNTIHAYQLEQEIRRAEFDFFNKIYLNDESSLVADYPLKFIEPIFGTRNSTFAEYVGTSYVFAWPTFVAFTLVVGFYTIERERNVHQMAYLVGTKRIDIILGYAFSFGIVMILYAILALVIIVNICNYPLHGSPSYFIILVVVQMIFYSTLGITIAKICKTWIGAASSIIFVSLLCASICGLVWPTNALPKWLEVISDMLPLTVGIRAARNVLQKGLYLTHVTVFPGFYIPLICCIVCVIFIAALIKFIPELYFLVNFFILNTNTIITSVVPSL